jgi:uncharacterized integral membrane protein
MARNEPGDATDKPVEQRDAGSAPTETGTEPQGTSRASESRRSERPKTTRVSTAWVTITVGVVLLILLLVFILQNPQVVDVSYFGATGRLPLGVALLLAAAAGALLVVVVGAARILQLRAHSRRQRYKKATPAGGEA